MTEYSARDGEGYSQIPASQGFEEAPFPLSPPLLTSSPIPLIRPKDESEPYPAEALGPLKPAADAIARSTQAPYALAAQSVLAVASLATQIHADVQSLHSVKPLSLFVLSVAESGERKSACDFLALEGVREFEKKRHEVYVAARNHFQDELDLYESRRRSILTKRQDLLATRADLEALGDKPIGHIAPQLLLSDPTVEGLVKHFDLAQPSLGLFSDEGGQLLGGYGMSADNKLKSGAALSKVWDGSPINRTRAGDGPSQTHFGKRLTCHLMVQPGIAETLVSDTVLLDQGLLSRMLVAWPNSRIGGRFIVFVSGDGDHDTAQEALSGFHRRIQDLLETGLPPDVKARLNRRTIELSDTSLELLTDFYNFTEGHQGQDQSFQYIRGFASKAAEQAARISGILQVFQNPCASEVSEDCMANAIALMNFYLSETKRLFGAASIPETLQKAELLRHWLCTGWTDNVIDIRSIVRCGPNSIRDSALARQLVGVLCENGWLMRVQGPQVVSGTKANTCWQVIRGS